VKAIRKGFQGGTLESKREDGRVYVCLDTDQDIGRRLSPVRSYMCEG
jgi:hypothetical protein